MAIEKPNTFQSRQPVALPDPAGAFLALAFPAGAPPLSEDQRLSLAEACFGTRRLRPAEMTPDSRLIARYGALNCLRQGLLPVRRAGGLVLVATSEPERFADRRAGLAAALGGRVAMVLASTVQIEAALLQACGPELARVAESRVRLDESCRTWGGPDLRAGALALVMAFAGMAFFDPILPGLILVVAAVLALLSGFVLKLAALRAALRPPPKEPPPPLIARLPVVSVMVALFREGDIAARLVERLSRLDYPRDLLDIVLVVEEQDHLTRNALAVADLPGWMRTVAVPHGAVKTKPRALNHALDQCRGSIIGIYDAEDAPEPDQIRKVVTRFHSRGPQVACLQGRLDYYNPCTNWISRCFTLEYAAWFRVLLPGVARLGLMVPLGGTTLFFRRPVLEELGGWDAHNVTEDADLGIRLFRRGYRTEILDTVTYEEANCRPVAWVKQRSRWIKGYMMTWAVHMRNPVLLCRQIGFRRFAGFQVQFLATLLSQLLAPVIWLFWLQPFGLDHPMTGPVPWALAMTVAVMFFLSTLLDMAVTLIARRRAGHRFSPLWILAQHAYFPLATLAAYKALREMITAPFYWDKTSHGHFDQPQSPH
ncbi:glycosyltransferase [Neotabrizicola sp. VNH66]|uniref:glycosyltransferase n=1 Tax=Neotabrizicola sp. VNH66 TaxID=3400918 RepID=UPI003BFDB757